jgi:MoaA/NifB/PqqE/SkfB family radical SAM enzyme
VAIDGLTDHSNSVFRKRARLAPALEGVRALADWKRRTGSRLPVLHCRFKVMRHNERELPALRHFAADAGFDMVSLRSLPIIDSAADAHRRLVPEDGALRAYRYEGTRRVQRADFVWQRAARFPTALTDGRVVACEQDYNGQQPYGVVGRDGSFGAIWRSAQAAAVRRVIRDDPAQYSFCRNCPFTDRTISSCSFETTRCGPSRCERPAGPPGTRARSPTATAPPGRWSQPLLKPLPAAADRSRGARCTPPARTRCGDRPAWYGGS